jgi:hypothetical protein
MQKKIAIVSEVKDFEELKTIIRNGKRDEMCAALGTHISMHSTAKEISDKAVQMLPKLVIWKQNWEALQTGFEPEIKELRAKELEEYLEDMAKFSPEQVQRVAQWAQARLDTTN